MLHESFVFYHFSWIHRAGSWKPCLCTEVCNRFQGERSSSSHSCKQCRDNVSTLWNNWRWIWATVWSEPSWTFCSDKSALRWFDKVSELPVYPRQWRILSTPSPWEARYLEKGWGKDWKPSQKKALHYKLHGRGIDNFFRNYCQCCTYTC